MIQLQMFVGQITLKQKSQVEVTTFISCKYVSHKTATSKIDGIVQPMS